MAGESLAAQVEVASRRREEGLQDAAAASVLRSPVCTKVSPCREIFAALDRLCDADRLHEPSAPLLVLGGPGCGKTTALLRWAARRVRHAARLGRHGAEEGGSLSPVAGAASGAASPTSTVGGYGVGSGSAASGPRGGPLPWWKVRLGCTPLEGGVVADQESPKAAQAAVVHLVGASRGSSTVRGMLARLVGELSARFRLGIEPSDREESLTAQFQRALEAAASSEAGGSVVLLLDDVHRLRSPLYDGLKWLPLHLPARVRIVMTASASDAEIALTLRAQAGGLGSVDTLRLSAHPSLLAEGQNRAFPRDAALAEVARRRWPVLALRYASAPSGDVHALSRAWLRGRGVRPGDKSHAKQRVRRLSLSLPPQQQRKMIGFTPEETAPSAPSAPSSSSAAPSSSSSSSSSSHLPAPLSIRPPPGLVGVGESDGEDGDDAVLGGGGGGGVGEGGVGMEDGGGALRLDGLVERRGFGMAAQWRGVSETSLQEGEEDGPWPGFPPTHTEALRGWLESRAAEHPCSSSPAFHRLFFAAVRLAAEQGWPVGRCARAWLQAPSLRAISEKIIAAWTAGWPWGIEGPPHSQFVRSDSRKRQRQREGGSGKEEEEETGREGRRGGEVEGEEEEEEEEYGGEVEEDEEGAMGSGKRGGDGEGGDAWFHGSTDDVEPEARGLGPLLGTALALLVASRYGMSERELAGALLVLFPALVVDDGDVLEGHKLPDKAKSKPYPAHSADAPFHVPPAIRAVLDVAAVSLPTRHNPIGALEAARAIRALLARVFACSVAPFHSNAHATSSTELSESPTPSSSTMAFSSSVVPDGSMWDVGGDSSVMAGGVSIPSLGEPTTPPSVRLMVPPSAVMLRSVVFRRFLLNGRALSRARAALVHFFATVPSAARRAEEIPWLLERGRRWTGLKRCLIQLPLVRALWHGPEREDLVRGWMVLSGITQPLPRVTDSDQGDPIAPPDENVARELWGGEEVRGDGKEDGDSVSDERMGMERMESDGRRGGEEGERRGGVGSSPAAVVEGAGDLWAQRIERAKWMDRLATGEGGHWGELEEEHALGSMTSSVAGLSPPATPIVSFSKGGLITSPTRTVLPHAAPTLSPEHCKELAALARGRDAVLQLGALCGPSIALIPWLMGMRIDRATGADMDSTPEYGRRGSLQGISELDDSGWPWETGLEVVLGRGTLGIAGEATVIASVEEVLGAPTGAEGVGAVLTETSMTASVVLSRLPAVVRSAAIPNVKQLSATLGASRVESSSSAGGKAARALADESQAELWTPEPHGDGFARADIVREYNRVVERWVRWQSPPPSFRELAHILSTIADFMYRLGQEEMDGEAAPALAVATAHLPPGLPALESRLATAGSASSGRGKDGTLSRGGKRHRSGGTPASGGTWKMQFLHRPLDERLLERIGVRVRVPLSDGESGPVRGYYLYRRWIWTQFPWLALANAVQCGNERLREELERKSAAKATSGSALYDGASGTGIGGGAAQPSFDSATKGSERVTTPRELRSGRPSIVRPLLEAEAKAGTKIHHSKKKGAKLKAQTSKPKPPPPPKLRRRRDSLGGEAVPDELVALAMAEESGLVEPPVESGSRTASSTAKPTEVTPAPTLDAQGSLVGPMYRAADKIGMPVPLPQGLEVPPIAPEAPPDRKAALRGALLRDGKEKSPVAKHFSKLHASAESVGAGTAAELGGPGIAGAEGLFHGGHTTIKELMRSTSTAEGKLEAAEALRRGLPAHGSDWVLTDNEVQLVAARSRVQSLRAELDKLRAGATEAERELASFLATEVATAGDAAIRARAQLEAGWEMLRALEDRSEALEAMLEGAKRAHLHLSEVATVAEKCPALEPGYVDTLRDSLEAVKAESTQLQREEEAIRHETHALEAKRIPELESELRKARERRQKILDRLEEQRQRQRELVAVGIARERERLEIANRAAGDLRESEEQELRDALAAERTRAEQLLAEHAKLQEELHAYSLAFQRIREATGSNDSAALLERWNARSSLEQALLGQRAEGQARLRHAREQKVRLERELDQLRARLSGANARRVRVLEDAVNRSRALAVSAGERCAAVQKTLRDVREGALHMCRLLDVPDDDIRQEIRKQAESKKEEEGEKKEKVVDDDGYGDDDFEDEDEEEDKEEGGEESEPHEVEFAELVDLLANIERSMAPTKRAHHGHHGDSSALGEFEDDDEEGEEEVEEEDDDNDAPIHVEDVDQFLGLKKSDGTVDVESDSDDEDDSRSRRGSGSERSRGEDRLMEGKEDPSAVFVRARRKIRNSDIATVLAIAEKVALERLSSLAKRADDATIRAAESMGLVRVADYVRNARSGDSLQGSARDEPVMRVEKEEGDGEGEEEEEDEYDDRFSDGKSKESTSSYSDEEFDSSPTKSVRKKKDEGKGDEVVEKKSDAIAARVLGLHLSDEGYLDWDELQQPSVGAVHVPSDMERFKEDLMAGHDPMAATRGRSRRSAVTTPAEIRRAARRMVKSGAFDRGTMSSNGATMGGTGGARSLPAAPGQGTTHRSAGSRKATDLTRSARVRADPGVTAVVHRLLRSDPSTEAEMREERREERREEEKRRALLRRKKRTGEDEDDTIASLLRAHGVDEEEWKERGAASSGKKGVLSTAAMLERARIAGRVERDLVQELMGSQDHVVRREAIKHVDKVLRGTAKKGK